MTKVVGLGGVFVKSRDPKALQRRVLWNPFSADTKHGYVVDPEGTLIELWQPRA